MNDKTKRIILITACCLLCGVAVIGIAGRFGGNTVTPSGTVSGSQPDSNDPNVNINNSQGDVNVPSLTPEQSDPGQGANSNGTEQTIQALQKNLSELHQANAELSARSKAYESSLENILSSSSWKLTLPLRRLLGLFHRSH